MDLSADYEKLHTDMARIRAETVCYCSAYNWPHGAGRGKCACSVQISYKVDPLRISTIQLDEICEGCGQPADVREIDCGIGQYEYWGAIGRHHDWQTVTECCEAYLEENCLSNGIKHWKRNYSGANETS